MSEWAPARVCQRSGGIVGRPELVSGVDPSSMMETARVPAGVQLVNGTAESIPPPMHSSIF